mmetsp:Transcript_18734/g.47867  ORF Transcript_18734/g.47867 Transcript_18734/m.47867 type:complete len:453 (-) Transcript_18734:527-1885(-)
MQIMMKHIVYSDAISFADMRTSADNGSKAAAKSTHAMTIDAPKSYLLAKVTTKDQHTLEEIAMHNAATKLQAATRGRRVRVRNRAMSREEGDKLWYSHIKPVIMKVFNEISGGDGSMNITEFVRWLNEEWKHQKMQAKGIAVPGYESDDGEPALASKETVVVSPPAPLRVDVGDVERREGGSTLRVEALDNDASERCQGPTGHDDEFFSTFFKELRRSGRLHNGKSDYIEALMQEELALSSPPEPFNSRHHSKESSGSRHISKDSSALKPLSSPDSRRSSSLSRSPGSRRASPLVGQRWQANGVDGSNPNAKVRSPTSISPSARPPSGGLVPSSEEITTCRCPARMRPQLDGRVAVSAKAQDAGDILSPILSLRTVASRSTLKRSASMPAVASASVLPSTTPARPSAQNRIGLACGSPRSNAIRASVEGLTAAIALHLEQLKSSHEVVGKLS